MFWSWPSGLSWLDWAMHVDPCFAYCVFTSQTCCFLLSVVPGVPGIAASIVYSLYLLPLVPKVVTPYPSQAPSHGSVSPWDKFSNLLWRLWFFLIFYLFTYLAVPDLGWGMQDLHWGMWTLNCHMWNLVPWPGIELRLPALGMYSLRHWTTKEVLLWRL